MLLMQAGEVSFSSVTVIRPPALPAPRPHLQPNYQWALTWCNIRSKQPISFPINLQPKCQAQQYSGLPVIQNCIMYIMFIKNQATSQARTPAPSL